MQVQHGGGVTGEPAISKPWILSPPLVTEQQDDYSPAGYTSDILLLRVACTGTVAITGLTGALPKRTIIFQNVGSGTFTFPEDSSDSSEGNRFLWGVNLEPGKIEVFQRYADYWAEFDYGDASLLRTALTSFLQERLVMVDAVGNTHTYDWIGVKPGSQQFIIGKDFDGNTVPLPGGYGLHAIDSRGQTGGEMFVWAVGTGTGHDGIMDDKDFVGRWWGMRMRGTIDSPLGILDGDAIYEMVGVGWGDNGNFNAAGETDQPEITNKVKITFRAVGNWTNGSRATTIEFYTTPTASLVRALAAAFDPDGSLNMHSHKITNVATPGADQDAATKKYVDDQIALRLPQ